MFKADIPFETIKEKYTDDQSKFISVDGMDVHYKDEGQGQVLVLLHSLNTSLHDWETWVQQLSAHYRVIRLDLPGFGLTMPSKEFDFKIDTYIYFFKRFTTQLQLATFHLGGAGFGADLAWHFAILSPYLVKKLVLVNPTDYPSYKPSFTQKMSRHTIGKIAYRWLGSEKIFQKRLAKLFVEPTKLPKETITRYYDFLLREGSRTTFVTVSNAYHRERFSRLSKLQNSTLVLWSEELGENPFAKQLPHTKTIYYKNNRLYPMIESPQRSASEVVSFLH